MTTGLYPFEGENVYKLFEVIGRGEYEIPLELDDVLRDLIQLMLQKDPSQRASLHAVKSHRYVVFLSF